MNWKTLKKIEARKLAARWTLEGKAQFEQMCRDLDTGAGNLNSEYRSLRSDLLKAWKETETEIEELKDEQKRKQYLTDLIFGIKLYRLLEERGMDVRLASYDAIWIYLGMCVVPEITFERFWKENKKGETGFRIPEDHYYVKSMRIYLKSLWWYIYLSLQFNREGKVDLYKTRRMLWYQTTDTILQLIERSGREGYRIDVCREIMKYYCEHPEISADDFRKILILNTARLQVQEPDFCIDGYEGYVKELFAYHSK